MSTDLTTTTEPKRQPPKDINPKAKAYAFERSLGIPPCEACRRAGGNDRNGQATKWERSRGVLAWIGYYRSLDCTEEMLAEKRRRIEDRLNLALYGDIFEFSTTVDRAVRVKVGETDDGDPIIKEQIIRSPLIDWDKVAASPQRAIIESFKFDKDTGQLVDFTRDSALQAGNQLRDMHGFKSVNKTALTDPTGNNPASVYLISEQPMTEAEWEAQRTGAA
jgi:hypothetical protein